MCHHPHFVQRTVAVIACGVLAVPGSTACADVEGSYAGPESYNVKITHMPDFDQKRKTGMGLLGLPFDFGSYHCVPTATMNVFAYAANHGFPTLAPGPAWWQSQSNYEIATANILTLGFAMDTGGSGTTSDDAFAGTVAWLQGSNITVNYYLAGSDVAPTINNVVASVSLGGIVTFGYGRYEYLGWNIVDHIGFRDGGHRVTFSAALRAPGSTNIIIKVRDPADDPDEMPDSEAHFFSQSPFSDRVYNSARNILTQQDFTFFQRTMTALVYPPPMPSDPDDDWQIRLLDGYAVFKPMSGYTWLPGGDGPIIVVFTPDMLGSLFGPNLDHHFAAFAHLFDVQFSADNIAAFLLAELKSGQTSLQSVDLVTGEAMEIMPIDGAKAMTVGRKHEIYVLTEDAVLCINPYDPIDPFEAQVTPPGPCTAICYDDGTDEVVLLSPDQQKIYRYQHRFPAGGGVQETCIPVMVPLEPDDGSMAVNPVDGKAWFLTSASNAIYHVPDAASCDVFDQIQIAGVLNPRSISFGDDGTMYVATDAGLMEVTFNERAGDWEAAPSQYFAGMDIGPKFHVTRSRTNFDPALHDGPGWEHVDPAVERNLEGTHVEIDCLADIVTSDTFQPPPDGVVDGADLAFLLGAWGDNDGSIADIVTSATFAPPEDGHVDGADLAFLLGAWGPCPQPN